MTKTMRLMTKPTHQHKDSGDSNSSGSSGYVVYRQQLNTTIG